MRAGREGSSEQGESWSHTLQITKLPAKDTQISMEAPELTVDPGEVDAGPAALLGIGVLWILWSTSGSDHALLGWALRVDSWNRKEPE